MALFRFPQQPTSAEAWASFLETSNHNVPDLLSYVYQLYERERALGTRYHQVLLALAHLADGYNPTSEGANANVLTQCVDCNQSVVVDGSDYGRFLPCGHVMHSFCMATYCETTVETSAPGCRRCGVRFFPTSCSPQSQLKVAIVLTAVRVLNGTPLPVMRQDFIDNAYESNEELDQLILATEQDDVAIKAVAQKVIAEHKVFLRSLSTVVAETLIPTVNENRPFPVLPAAVTDAQPPKKKQQSAQTQVAKPAVAMPPAMEPDVLPPTDSVIPKGTRYMNRSIMFTAFSSKCKLCKRPQEQGRTIIASGDQGFACCICVFSKTSADVFTEVLGTPSVDSMF